MNSVTTVRLTSITLVFEPSVNGPFAGLRPVNQTTLLRLPSNRWVVLLEEVTTLCSVSRQVR